MWAHPAVVRLREACFYKHYGSRTSTPACARPFRGSRGNTPRMWTGNGWSAMQNCTTFRIALVSFWNWRERGPSRWRGRSPNWRRLAWRGGGPYAGVRGALGRSDGSGARADGAGEVRTGGGSPAGGGDLLLGFHARGYPAVDAPEPLARGVTLECCGATARRGPGPCRMSVPRRRGFRFCRTWMRS